MTHGKHMFILWWPLGYTYRSWTWNVLSHPCELYALWNSLLLKWNVGGITCWFYFLAKYLEFLLCCDVCHHEDNSNRGQQTFCQIHGVCFVNLHFPINPVKVCLWCSCKIFWTVSYRSYPCWLRSSLFFPNPLQILACGFSCKFDHPSLTRPPCIFFALVDTI